MIQRTLLALSDPTRREILRMLKKSNRTMSEIAERFDISAPAISRHLSVLKDAELVSSRREGKFIYYSPCFDAIEEARDWLKSFLE